MRVSGHRPKSSSIISYASRRALGFRERRGVEQLQIQTAAYGRTRKTQQQKVRG